MSVRVLLGSIVAAAAMVLSPAVWAQGKQDFTLVNQTGYAISHLYVAPSKSNSWDEDILGQDVLGVDEQVDIEFERSEQTCHWDLMVTYADDNSKAVWYEIDFCRVAVVTIHYIRATDTTSATFE